MVPSRKEHSRQTPFYSQQTCTSFVEPWSHLTPRESVLDLHGTSIWHISKLRRNSRNRERARGPRARPPHLPVLGGADVLRKAEQGAIHPLKALLCLAPKMSLKTGNRTALAPALETNLHVIPIHTASCTVCCAAGVPSLFCTQIPLWGA